MSCCHKHQQQMYHNENTKICMFTHNMYVDILFAPTKAIPIMFERVTTHYQTPQTWVGHNTTHYRTFSFSMVWGLFPTGYHELSSNL